MLLNLKRHCFPGLIIFCNWKYFTGKFYRYLGTRVWESLMNRKHQPCCAVDKGSVDTMRLPKFRQRALTFCICKAYAKSSQIFRRLYEAEEAETWEDGAAASIG